MDANEALNKRYHLLKKIHSKMKKQDNAVAYFSSYFHRHSTIEQSEIDRIVSGEIGIDENELYSTRYPDERVIATESVIKHRQAVKEALEYYDKITQRSRIHDNQKSKTKYNLDL